ncbi:hypothetical protein OROHE_011512 [Orobanche hederae]
MTTLSGHCSDSVLGKRKDTEPCRSQFAEATEQGPEQAGAASEIKDSATENKDAAAKDKDDGDDVSRTKCRICLQLGHWTFFCPYKRYVPEGTEVVGAGYVLVCYHCGRDEFDELKCCDHSGRDEFDELKCCDRCGSSLKRLCTVFCYFCSAKDHLFSHCPSKGTDDFTIDIDDYVPPPSEAQGVAVCAGE